MMGDRKINFTEVVARRKLGVGDDWLMHGWEVVGNTDDLIVRGGVPVGLCSRGPRKGRPKWAGKSDSVVVTRAEERAERLKYEADTGKCHECQGTKETWAGWNCDTGDKYRPCRRCNATGVAREQSP